MTAVFSALLAVLPPSLVADLTPRDMSREVLSQTRTQNEVLQGLNGLVASPVMSDAKGLPHRLMGVGVDDRGMVFVTETVRQMKEEISLLQSTFLHEPDMALTTVEEKEAWIRANFSARIAQAQEVQDYNQDIPPHSPAPTRAPGGCSARGAEAIS